LTREIVEIVSERDREEEALDLLLAALEKDPLNIDLLWAQANLYRNSGRPQDAKQPLLTALKLAPDNPDLYNTLGWLAHNQEDFVEAMNWFRQAVIADPEDPHLASVIASIFYSFGLLREGDFWLDRVRSIDPNRMDLIVRLEIMSAAAAQDQDRLLEVVEGTLPLVLSADVDYFLPSVYYPALMSARGRSQEALDHLTELIPDLQDYSKLTGKNRFSQNLQFTSFGLQGDVLDEESFNQLAASYVIAAEALYPDWRVNFPKMNVINFEVWLGNHDGAKQVFLEAHADWPMYTGQWLQFQVYPWLEELRNEPEVATVVEQYLQKKARIADELREMLKQPEWSH
jgi:tetratricopeptide (TPR) repeat protein